MALSGIVVTHQLQVALDLASDFRPEQKIECRNCVFVRGNIDLSWKVSNASKQLQRRKALCPCAAIRPRASPRRNSGSKASTSNRHVKESINLSPANHVSGVEDSMIVQETSLIITQVPDIQWREIDERVILGDCPTESAHVDTIYAIGAKALINFQRPEEDSISFSWEDLSFKATSLEVVTARVPMDSYDTHNQALNLAEAVKIVATLTVTGRKVYLCDAGSNSRSALVIVGYLTFVKGMELNDALEVLYNVDPTANPSIAAWEQARNRILAGHATTVANQCKMIEAERLRNHTPGTSARDWLDAQKQVISELLQDGIQTQVSLAEAMTQIAVLQANRVLIDESLEKDRKAAVKREPNLSMAGKLLLEVAGMEKSEIANVLANSSAEEAERAAITAAESVKSRLQSLQEELSKSDLAKTDTEKETSSVKQSMASLKLRLDNLLKQVVAERSTAALAEQQRNEAVMEAQMLSDSLQEERESIARVKNQTLEQISGLQGQLAGMQSELESAKTRVVELERMLEDEKASAKATVNKLQNEAKSQEQKLQQTVASLRLKIEQAAALYRKELEEVLMEQEAALEQAEQRQQAELKRVEDGYKTALSSMEIGQDSVQAALQLQSAIAQNESLSEELLRSQECMSQMSSELANLNSKVAEDRLKREAQVEEELAILRSAQAHVDRMAAEKLSLIQQKQMLQKVIVATLALALAGPFTVLTMMTSGNVPQVDAVEVKATQQMVRLMDPSFHERRAQFEVENAVMSNSFTSKF